MRHIGSGILSCLTDVLICLHDKFLGLTLNILQHLIVLSIWATEHADIVLIFGQQTAAGSLTQLYEHVCGPGQVLDHPQ